ncbi:cupredoxin domain-containing protein [Pyxidicoccus sp. MSG2]|uniref:cupredoxin domain-containing protein n=1 Tax=Pyxidicoccus sp. MSG2 TaxID=2996790 RepID=UPI0022720425|nr:cupredoxin domain-containing protein [Pyxidicoccus sp. MSG2]MCY1024006.1 cupredoxin domain-containing protein [Pyxidicoccus sp. MSG2]
MPDVPEGILSGSNQPMKMSLMGALASLTLMVATPAAACAEHAKQSEPTKQTEHAKQAAHGGAARTAPAEKPASAPTVKNGVHTVELAVTSKGFEPANVKVKAGQPVRMVVTRKTDKTCATEIVVADLGINQPLPLDTPVTVEFTPSESGTLRYACAMDHISGLVTIQ